MFGQLLQFIPFESICASNLLTGGIGFLDLGFCRAVTCLHEYVRTPLSLKEATCTPLNVAAPPALSGPGRYTRNVCEHWWASPISDKEAPTAFETASARSLANAGIRRRLGP